MHSLYLLINKIITDIYKYDPNYDKNKIKLLKINQNQIINSDVIFGSTPLIWAIRHQNFDIVKELVKNKADVNKKDNDGHTPLYWGKLGKESEYIAEYLKEKGAKE